MISSPTPPPDVRRIPAELAELAKRVTRDTRLWPSEKRDIQAELESHFSEGLVELLEEGMTLDQCISILREQFGDAAVAARLIRRAKKRARPMVYKVVILAGCTAVAGVTSAAGYAAWVFSGKPNPAVDYVAEINAPIEAIPETDRAWPLLRQALIAYTPAPEELNVPAMPSPGDDNWVKIQDWIRSNRDILPVLRQAVQRPEYGYVYDNEAAYALLHEQFVRRGERKKAAEYAQPPEVDPLMPPLIGVLLPNLSDHRSIARLLVLSSRDQRHAGDLEGAVTALDTSARLGMLLMSSQTLIEQLVGAAILQLTLPELREVLQKHAGELNPATLSLLHEGPLAGGSTRPIKINLNGENLMFKDLVQYLFTDDGTGNGHIIPEQFSRYSEMFFGTSSYTDMDILNVSMQHADRRETMKKYEELWGALSELRTLPLYDPARDRENRLLEELLAGTNKRFELLRKVVPSLSRADMMVRQANMQVEGTHTAMAIAEFVRRTGKAPGSLDALVPKFLSGIPDDVYSPNTLVYTVDPDGAHLYSVGQNLTDDDGSVEETDVNGRLVPADIVFWGN